MSKRKKPGPPKQNTGGAILLKLPADLRAHVETAAEAEGVSVSEWLRRAARERALRQAAKT